MLLTYSRPTCKTFTPIVLRTQDLNQQCFALGLTAEFTYRAFMQPHLWNGINNAIFFRANIVSLFPSRVRNAQHCPGNHKHNQFH